MEPIPGDPLPGRGRDEFGLDVKTFLAKLPDAGTETERADGVERFQWCQSGNTASA